MSAAKSCARDEATEQRPFVAVHESGASTDCPFSGRTKSSSFPGLIYRTFAAV